MLQALLIMLLVFAVIALLNWGSLRILKFSEERKLRIRNFFWVVFGIYHLAYSIFLWFDHTSKILSIVYFIFGIVLLVLAWYKRL